MWIHLFSVLVLDKNAMSLFEIMFSGLSQSLIIQDCEEEIGEGEG